MLQCAPGRTPALQVCQVLSQALAGGLHAADDAAQALRLGEAAVVVVEGVRDVLLALRGRPWERRGLGHVPAPRSIPSPLPLRRGSINQLLFAGYSPSLIMAGKVPFTR